MMANSCARAHHEGEGLVKVLSDPDSDKILGLHIVSACASEAIAEAVLAMETGATAGKVGGASHPHPTMSEGIKEAAAAACFKSIHLYS